MRFQPAVSPRLSKPILSGLNSPNPLAPNTIDPCVQKNMTFSRIDPFPPAVWVPPCSQLFSVAASYRAEATGRFKARSWMLDVGCCCMIIA
jgi:hypothetical protein